MANVIQTEAGPRFIKSKAEVGKYFKKLRESKKLGKSEFSRELGVSPEYYHYLEIGKYYPKFETLTVLRQLGVNLDDVFILSNKEVAALRKLKK